MIKVKDNFLHEAIKNAKLKHSPKWKG